ncbi:MAG: tripartite tricarboxylate transporter TctB family protein [Pseudomonadota bacterium]
MSSLRWAAPIFVGALGVAMFGLALTQPAWLGNTIGPGLFARWLSAAVILMSAIWLLSEVLLPERSALDAEVHDQSRKISEASLPTIRSGVGLLAGVMTFALAFPVVGLVAGCGLTAAVASWGAGERTVSAFAFSALAGATAALVVGMTLMPPGTQLWP